MEKKKAAKLKNCELKKSRFSNKIDSFEKVLRYI